MTLQEAIEKRIEAGDVDPHIIAQKLRRKHGTAWIVEQVAAIAEEVVATYARERIRAHRHAAEPVFGSGSVRDAAEALQGEGRWVPGVGWKRYADLTATDCRIVAEHYRSIERAAGVRAEQFEQFADLIEAEGVSVLGEVPTALVEMAVAA